jgi:hypothetical protein
VVEVVGVILALHLLAIAAILGGWIADAAKKPWGLPLMLWAARAQLLIGALLVVMALGAEDGLDFVKIGVKIVVALAVVALVEIANARIKKERGPAAALTALAAALTVANTALSFLWQG